MTSPVEVPVAGPLHTVLQPEGWPEPQGHRNGILAEGRLVVTGGIIGSMPDGSFPQTFAAQARQAFANIAAVLRQAGAGPAHLVRMTWYVTDIDEYLSHPKDLGAAYREVLGSHFPAMTVVQVMRLVEYAAKLQIEATAVLPAA